MNDQSTILRIGSLALVMFAGCGGAAHQTEVRSAPSASASNASSAAPTAVASASPAPSAASSHVTTQDEAMTFGAGATFTAPTGWTVEIEPTRAALTSPERDLHLTLVERAAPDAESAIRDAWHSVDPNFAREVEHQASPPARDGWDEITQIAYRTAPSESRSVIAVALRKGQRYYVALVDGAISALSRRGGQLMLSVQSLRAPGVTEESWAGRTAHPLDDERAAQFEQFIRNAMTAIEIPGVAVGVVQGGHLVFSHGFGTRVLGGHDAVTPRSLFMIGSNTKSLTTLMMARLVDANRIHWDTPITQILPGFHLGDPEMTQRLDVQHTVCACTGMPRRDLEFLFEFAHATPEHWLETLGTMRPTTGFGEVFQYSNLLVAAGGYAAAHAAQPRGDLAHAIDRAMRDEVFAPLGMRSTTLSIREAERHEHASPHGRTLAREVRAIPLTLERGVESVGPAGAAWSNLEDMANVVLMELHGGMLANGTRYLSESALMERRRTHIRMAEHDNYGLGLITTDAHGVTFVHHGGNTLGFSSDYGFFPELDLGIVVLTNGAGENGFIRAVERRLMELVLDARPEAEESIAFIRNDRRRGVEEELARIDQTVPHDWIAPLLGTYHNADLGTLTVTEHGGEVLLDAGEWRLRAGRKNGANHEASLIILDPPLAGLEFTASQSADGDALVLDYPQSPYRFARVAAAR